MSAVAGKSPPGTPDMKASGFRQRTFLLRALALALIVLGGFVPASAQQQPPPAPGPIQVRVDRVYAGAIVTGADGAFVQGLPRGSFHILDNGAEQPLVDFADTESPAQVLLLIEAGPSVYLLGSGHVRAAYLLLQGLAAGDSVAIASYTQSAQPLLDFTTDKHAAAAALDDLRFNLGYGSLDLSSSLQTVLGWLARAPGKKSVVLLSTGVDTSPAASVPSLLAQLQTGDVRVFAVSLGGELRGAPAAPPSGKRGKRAAPNPPAPAVAGQFAEADRFLQALADASGGRAYFPRNGAEFQQAYAQIAQLLRHEYTLSFVPSADDGNVHTIEVHIEPPPGASLALPLRIESRRAYRAPNPAAR